MILKLSEHYVSQSNLVKSHSFDGDLGSLSVDLHRAAELAESLDAGASCHEVTPWAAMSVVLVDGDVVWRCEHDPFHQVPFAGKKVGGAK